MGNNPTTDWAGLPVMTREQAKEERYASITTCFDPTAEPAVVRSMERSMRGIDAVWIVARSGYRQACELARRPWEINRLLDGDGRVLTKGWEEQHQQVAARNR